MAKKIEEYEDDEDEFDLEDEEEEEEEEEDMDTPTKPRKKKKVAPIAKKESVKENDFLWQQISQQPFEGFQNVKTEEIISSQEALRRILSYAEEAAKNTR